MLKKTIKFCKNVVIFLMLIVPMTALAALSIFSYFTNTAPHSFADHLHLTRVQNAIDGGWLPDLAGLPNQAEVVNLTKNVEAVMSKVQDPECNAIDWRLRMMIFQHFVIYQQMANAQNIYFDHTIAHQWAHILAMILKESGGDPLEVTSFSSDYSMFANQPDASLQQWRQIVNLVQNSRMQLNYQTNFGLTQTSFDRLFVAFRLAQDQQYDTSYLEGRDGAATPRKTVLNTAIAIRRLVWFYQSIAQGRTSEDQDRINQQDIYTPEFNARYKESLNMALLYCGTEWMYHSATPNTLINGMTTSQSAMDSIAYCNLGNMKADESGNKLDEICYAQWVTLCPALNVDIATLTPLSYFQTRGAQPVCEKTFNYLIKKKAFNLFVDE
jgi:hypothetical protein